ncbi:SDR family NAD(P)-dependent oxidoreductase [Anabaena sp. PCC 7108]|uniref:SDR family NAD(P)-dependent oxidoreductase n=1 Tax=Anabaena sp. PCC 7108 TaxID=163908 RepID=UPI00034700EC|nr:SDR family NAD(P)-dependent oxidoreductase [Anabaena sp. PCC 7108]
MSALDNASNNAAKKSLTEQKQELFKLLLQKKGINLKQKEIIPRRSPSAENCVSFAQQRLWFLAQLEGASVAYNMPAVLRIKGNLEVACLQKSIDTIIQRHEVLRTTFKTVNGLPIQAIASKPEMIIPLVDLQELSADIQAQETKRLTIEATQTPFDLENGPLLRASLLRLHPQEYLLILTMHHIIFDGWSIGILVRELSTLYPAFLNKEAISLPDLPIQYADFAHWQRQWLQGDVLETQLAYWQKQLTGVSPLDLPTDYPRPPVQTYRGAKYSFDLPQSLALSLKQFSQAQGATLFMTLLTAFASLLGRYSSQDDIVIGSPIANRNRPELEGLIGFFANTLAWRINLAGDPTFIELLGHVREMTMQAYAHQDLPFEMLVEKLKLERNLSYNPLFQVMFALQNAPSDDLNLPGVTMEREEIDSGTSHFDLSLHVWESADGLSGFLTYNTDLFELGTVTDLVSRFQQQLEGILSCPTQPLSKLLLLSETEQQELLQKGNVMTVDLMDGGLCVHQLFEAEVERNSEAIALVAGSQQLTYQTLNAQANQLAHYLQSLGVKPGIVVGICLEHPLQLIMALLGVLKVGGTCLLMETAAKTAALALTCQRTKPNIILTGQRSIEHFRQLQTTERKCRILCLDAEQEAIAKQAKHNPSSDVTATTLAQLLYASNRLVQIDHHSICARIAQIQSLCQMNSEDSCLTTASLVQETAFLEIFWTLTTGGRLIIPLETERENPSRWIMLIREYQVSLLHSLPESLTDLVNYLNHEGDSQSLGSLRMVVYRGRQLPQAITLAFRQHYIGDLQHLYTLPEAGAIASYGDRPGSQSHAGYTPCGSILVLDRHFQPVPVGVKGKIYLGGNGLARGYFQNCAETAARFMQIFHLKDISKNIQNRWFSTGITGRWLRDGTLELLDSSARQVWIQGYHIALEEIETALLAIPVVEDCRVLARETITSTPELIAYVVLSERFRLEQLQNQVQNCLPPHLWPSSYLFLPSLPITAAGEIDDQALAKIPVVDLQECQQWEERLQSVPDLGELAVVVQEKLTHLPLLHLSEVVSQNSLITTGFLEASTTLSRKPSAKIPVDGTVNLEKRETKAWAISDGGSLVIPADAPRTLTAALVETARKYPNQGIVLIQTDGSEVIQTYSVLLEEAKCKLTGLSNNGLKAGDRVILQISCLQDYFSTLWACILGGIIPVTVAVAPTYDQHNVVAKKLLKVWELLKQPIILASDFLIEPIRNLRRSPVDNGLSVLGIDSLRHHPPASEIPAGCPEDVVFLQLTSGSTGVPKVVPETHRGIITHIHAAQQFNGYQPFDISLNWLPLDHVVPLLTCHLKDVYLGCQQVEVPTALILENPLNWLDLIQRYQVTHTWSPNFAYKLVSDALQQVSQRHWNLSSVKFFMNAGEQVTRPVVQEFLEQVAAFGVSPQAMQPAFGMAEVCTCMTYQNHFQLDGTGVYCIQKNSLGDNLQFASTTDEAVSEFVDLGLPVPGVQIRITDTNNQVLAEGAIGQLQIKGDVVTPGYVDHPEANREAFVGDGWFNTGDLGFILNRRLILTGRKKEQIVVNGVNYYCYEIEDLVNSIEEVEPTYVAALGFEDTNRGTEGLAIFFVPKSSVTGVNLIKQIRTYVTSNLGITPACIIPVKKQEFPKTTSGKIQRHHLKQQLITGAFKEQLKQIDIQLGNENTIPSWFYRQIWKRKQAHVVQRQVQTGHYLIFMDSLGLGAFLCQKLQQDEQQCICVEMGSNFDQIDATHYRIVPGDFDHYRQLFESLASNNIHIGQVIHLWNYENQERAIANLSKLEQAQERGVYSLLFFVQALTTIQPTQQPVRLQVVANHTQSVVPGDTVASEKALMLGLLKTINQEFPGLSCSHIDLPINAVTVNGNFILRECQVANKDREIAYRHQQRWVSRLERIDLGQTEKQPLPFKSGGMYLISGGLGGIGVEIAKFLLKHYQAHIILVGRTLLPDHEPEADAPEKLGSHADHLKTYYDLKRLGGACLYAAVDVSNLEQLQQVIDRTQALWQRELDGVIHLAGVSHESLLQAETRTGLAATLHPKVSGTWTLHQLLKQQPEKFFISFSSVNAFFGGFGAGAYAAANSFLEAFAQEQRQQGLRSYCFAWSMWDEVGMSRHSLTKEQAQSRGYSLITKQQGLQSFLAALQHGSTQLLIGLNDRSPNVRRYMTTTPKALHLLMFYLTGQSEALKSKLAQLGVCDRFGTQSPWDSIHLSELPSTETGAIDREQLIALNRQNIRPLKELIAPRTEIEQQVAQIWQEILSLSKVGVDDNFFELGGHSLLATQLVFRLSQTFAIDLSIPSLFEHPTVAKLSVAIEIAIRSTQGQTAAAGIQWVSRDQSLPLSFAQQRLWFLDRLEEGKTATYNMPTALYLTGSLHIEALEQSIIEIMRRHEVLRTTFPTVNGSPVQAIAAEPQLNLTRLDLQGLTPDQQTTEVLRLATEEAHRPFDLANGPLLRVTLLKLGEQSHVLLVTIHHICSDGWSVALYTRELSILYQAFSTGATSPLPKLPIQYADFAYWQHQWLASSELDRQLAYWQQRLQDAPPILKLPNDYPRQAVQSFRGNAQAFILTPDLSKELKVLSRRTGTTLFMVLFAAFAIVLHYYSGQDDLVLGTDVANRNRAETEGLIGFFVNQLALRLDLSGNPTFSQELLGRVRERALEAYTNQDLPFDRLVEKLNVERSLSYNPVFQAKLVLQNTPKVDLELPGLSIKPLVVKNETASYDLLLNVEETEQGLEASLRYSTDLFKPTTITRIVEHFQMVLQTVVIQPDLQLNELAKLLADTDKTQQMQAEQEIAKVSLQKLKGRRRKEG